MKPDVVPTSEQWDIICEDGSLVVLAKPGSGKTYVISEKIRRALVSMPNYRGVIAISYTNKASNELRRRVKKDNFDVRSSFLGTIDKFCYSEIIRPFLPHIWGKAPDELPVVRVRDLTENSRFRLTKSWMDRDEFYYNFSLVKEKYRQGYLVLESMSALALYVINESLACQRYIKSP